MTLTHPLPGYSYLGNYGPRQGFWGSNGVWIPPMFHEGEDFAAPHATPIRAAHPGQVVSAYNDRTGGWMVTIQGTGEYSKYRTRYLHMYTQPSVKKGDVVKQGQVIGGVGSTGIWTTGNHLHYEVWINGRVVNPVPYLKKTPKGITVTHKLFQNREKNRKIQPGKSLYLVDKNGKKLDINPDVGLNQTIVHVKVSGLTPGDTIWAVLEWYKPAVAGKAGVRHAVPAQTSGHFPETAVADNEGDVSFSVPFVRAVSKGWFVHLKVVASPKNKKTGTVHWIDADVIHYN